MGENKDAATIWRGPLKIGAIRQFISDIELKIKHYLENGFCRQKRN
jgi:Mrp family chromosome partitioning ATPase